MTPKNSFQIDEQAFLNSASDDNTKKFVSPFADAPKPKPEDDVEDAEDKSYASLGIKLDDAYNPFKAIDPVQWLESPEKRSEQVDQSISRMRDGLMSPDAKVPSLIDGKIEMVPANAAGRLTSAGLHAFDSAMQVLSMAEKDEGGGYRVNPMTNEQVPLFGSSLMTPYDASKSRENLTSGVKKVVVNEQEYDVKSITPDQVGSEQHVRSIIDHYKQQIGRDPLKMQDFDVNALLEWRDTIKSEVLPVNPNNVEAVTQTLDTRDTVIDDKVKAQMASALGRLKAEANMPQDKLVDLYEGQPIFNYAEIKDLNEFESQFSQLNLPKADKARLLASFRTNFESNAGDLMQQAAEGSKAWDYMMNFAPPVAVANATGADVGFNNEDEYLKAMAEGRSFYDMVKSGVIDVDRNQFQTTLEKTAMSTLASFQNTGTAGGFLLLKGLGNAAGLVSEDAENAFDRGAGYMAEAASVVQDAKRQHYENLGKVDNILGVGISSDDIYDLVGNIAETFATGGLGSAASKAVGKTALNVGARSMTNAAARQLGKESAKKIAQDATKAGIQRGAFKNAITSAKEQAKAMWLNSSAVGKTESVLATSIHGSFTSAGGALSEGMKKGLDKAAMLGLSGEKATEFASNEATGYGLVNGVATFVMMTAMNSISPGIEKVLAAPQEGLSAMTAIRNTIANRASRKSISSLLKEVVTDDATRKTIVKGIANEIGDVVNNNGVKKYLGGIAAGSASEFIEEAGDTALALAGEAYLLQDADARKLLEKGGYWNEVLKAGVLGALGGISAGVIQTTSEGKQKALMETTKAMEEYKQTLPDNIKSRMNTFMSVKSDTAQSGRRVDEVKNILATGSTVEKVDALVNIGKSIAVQAGSTPAQQATTPPTTAAPASTATPVVTPAASSTAASTPTAVNPQASAPLTSNQAITVKDTNKADVVINAPTTPENLAKYAYKEAHGEDADVSELKPQTKKKDVPTEKGNVVVTSYMADGKPADIHSFTAPDGTTVFANKATLAQKIKDTLGVNKVSVPAGILAENKIVPLPKTAESTPATSSQTGNAPTTPASTTPKETTPAVSPTKTESQSTTPPASKETDNQPASKPESEPQVTTSPADRVNSEQHEIVGDEKIKSNPIRKAFEAIKPALKRLKLSVVFINDISELAEYGLNVDIERNRNVPGFTIPMSGNTKKDIVVVNLSKFTTTKGFLTLMKHEHFHVFQLQYNRTKEGARLSLKAAEEIANNPQVDEFMRKEYSEKYSSLSVENKFFEFSRAFISGKINGETLGRLGVPNVLKWLKSFLSYAKKQIGRNTELQSYFNELEAEYAIAVKANKELFNHKASNTNAFKAFFAQIRNAIKPDKTLKKGNVFSTRDGTYADIADVADGIRYALNESIALGEKISPSDVLEFITRFVNETLLDVNVGLSPASKAAIYREVVKNWSNDEDIGSVKDQLEEIAKSLLVHTEPMIGEPTSVQMAAEVEEKINYSQYTNISKFIREDKVIEVETPKPVIAAAIVPDRFTNAQVVGELDIKTGLPIGLGLERGDVVEVVGLGLGEVKNILVYSHTEVIPDSKTGEKKVYHRFIKTSAMINGKTTDFGKAVQSNMSEQFVREFKESGLVDKMFKVKDGVVTISQPAALLEFVFNSLVFNSKLMEGKKPAKFDDLFKLVVSSPAGNTSPFYYQDGKIVVDLQKLGRDFSGLNPDLLTNKQTAETISLLAAQTVRTAVEEELLHHVTASIFKPKELVGFYDDLASLPQFDGLRGQIMAQQGIDTPQDKLSEAEKMVIAGEFLSFIHQKSIDGATYGDQYNELMDIATSLAKSDSAKTIGRIYGKRYRDILGARSATAFMSPRMTDMLKTLTAVKSEAGMRRDGTGYESMYANFSTERYNEARSRFQRSIDDAFIQQSAAVNDLRTFLRDVALPVRQILDFDTEKQTVNLVPEFRTYYQGRMGDEAIAALDDYFSRLNDSKAVGGLIDSIRTAYSRMNALLVDDVNFQVGLTEEQMRQRSIERQQAIDNYNSLVTDYAELILNKNVNEVDEFGRNFDLVGTEIGIDVKSNYPTSYTPESQDAVFENTDAPNTPRLFTTPDGRMMVGNRARFEYEPNMFGYQNQSPIFAQTARGAKRAILEKVDLETAKKDQAFVEGYLGRYVSDDRKLFPDKVVRIEANAAFLGEEEYNNLMIARINGDKLPVGARFQSYEEFRKTMGFNPLDAEQSANGDVIPVALNRYLDKLVIPDKEIDLFGTDKNKTTIRKISTDKTITNVKNPVVAERALGDALGILFKDLAVDSWLNGLHDLIGYDPSTGANSVVSEIAGKETFASKFAKQIAYRIYGGGIVQGSGSKAKLVGADGVTLYELLRKFRNAYYTLNAGVSRPADFEKTPIDARSVKDLIAELPTLLEAIDALNQDIGLARKAYARFTSKYVSNTIMGDIRLIQEQDAEGIRANQELLNAIKNSYYDIQGMDYIEFLINYISEGGQVGIKGLTGLDLMHALVTIPESAQNEYHITNLQSEKAKQLADYYATFEEAGLKLRGKDADGKTGFALDNLVFNIAQRVGDRLDESDENFTEDRDIKANQPDEAPSEALLAYRRKQLHQEVKRLKSWTNQAALSIFQDVTGDQGNQRLAGLNPTLAKRFFNLFAKAANEEYDLDKVASSYYSSQLTALVRNQMIALGQHYAIQGKVDERFLKIADNVMAYGHPMPLLMDVVEIIAEKERTFLAELNTAGELLGEVAVTKLEEVIRVDAKTPIAQEIPAATQSKTGNADDYQASIEYLEKALNEAKRKLHNAEMNPFGESTASYKQEVADIEKQLKELKSVAIAQSKDENSVSDLYNDLVNAKRKLTSVLFEVEKNGNVQVSLDKVAYFAPSQLVSAIGISRAAPIMEIKEVSDVRRAIDFYSKQISEIELGRTAIKSETSYNQRAAENILGSLREDMEKGRLVAGTLFKANTFKFKSDESMTSNDLFMHSPLFSAILQAMPNLLIYQPNETYEGKTTNVPNDIEFAQFGNGDGILYIGNAYAMPTFKQAEVLRKLLVAQIRQESNNGKQGSALQQTISDAARVVREQATYALNLTSERIESMVDKARGSISGVKSLDAEAQDMLLEKYRSALQVKAMESMSLLTSHEARAKYLQNELGMKDANVDEFFNKLVKQNSETADDSIISDIELVVAMLTNPDAYRLLNNLKSPELTFEAQELDSKYNSVIDRALGALARPEIPSSELQRIALEQLIRQDEEVGEEFVDPVFVEDILASLEENFNEGDQTQKPKLTKKEVKKVIKNLPLRSIKHVVDDMILKDMMETATVFGNRSALKETLEQTIDQTNFLYRYVASNLINALNTSNGRIEESILELGSPSTGESVFDRLKSVPTSDIQKALKDRALPVLMESIGNSDISARGNLVNFYYNNSPTTEVFNIRRKNKFAGLLIAKTSVMDDLLKQYYAEFEQSGQVDNDNKANETINIFADEFADLINQVEDQVADIIGRDLFNEAIDNVDRVAESKLEARTQALERIEQLKANLEAVKTAGSNLLLETATKNAEAMKKATDVLLDHVSNKVSKAIYAIKKNADSNAVRIHEAIKNNDSIWGTVNRYAAKIAKMDSDIESLLSGRSANIEGDSKAEISLNEMLQTLVGKRNKIATRASLYMTKFIADTTQAIVSDKKYKSVRFDANKNPFGSILSREISNSIDFGLIDVTTVGSRGVSFANYLRDNSARMMNASAQKAIRQRIYEITSFDFSAKLASMAQDRQDVKDFANAAFEEYSAKHKDNPELTALFSRLNKGNQISKAVDALLKDKGIESANTLAKVRALVAQKLNANPQIQAAIQEEVVFDSLESVVGVGVEAGLGEEFDDLVDNVSSEIEEISSEIDRLQAIVDAAEVDSFDKDRTLFKVLLTKAFNEEQTMHRLQNGKAPTFKIEVDLQAPALPDNADIDAREERQGAMNRVRYINEAIRLFLERDGNILYKALTEEVEVYGQGFDIRQNIDNAIKLSEIKNTLDRRQKAKFDLLASEANELDIALKEANPMSLQLYGMTVSDMNALGLEPVVITEEAIPEAKRARMTEGEIAHTVKMMQVKHDSERMRMMDMALFIKDEHGMSIYVPTHGKEISVPSKSYLVVKRTARQELDRFKKATNATWSVDAKLKDVIFRASKNVSPTQGFLKTQAWEEIDVDMDSPISNELAKATGVDPAMSVGNFIKLAKKNFNKFFLKQQLNKTIGDFASGIGVIGTIKPINKMHTSEIEAMFNDIASFASNSANSKTMQNAGFNFTPQAGKAYSLEEKTKVVAQAIESVVNENKFLDPSNNLTSALIANEALLTDIVTMLHTKQLKEQNADGAYYRHVEEGIKSIASIFENESKTAQATSRKGYTVNTAIRNLDLHQNYTRLYSILYGEDTMSQLIAGVHNPKQSENVWNQMTVHENATIRHKFGKNYGSYQKALSLLGILDHGISGNSGRNQKAAKYQEFQDRVGKASKAIGDDFSKGAKAYLVASLRGVLIANEQDGGDPKKLGVKLYQWATAFDRGISHHQQLLKNQETKRKGLGLIKKGVATVNSGIRKQLRENANIAEINKLIEAEIKTITYHTNLSMITPQIAETIINQIERKLLAGYSQEEVAAMNHYSDVLLEEFEDISNAHRIANTFASEAPYRSINDFMNRDSDEVSSALRQAYSVMPLRFGHSRNPLDTSEDKGASEAIPISDFTSFEKSLMNYKGASLKTALEEKDGITKILRPIDLNPFTAPDQLAEDALYRINVTPSYMILKKLMGSIVDDGTGAQKITQHGHLNQAIANDSTIFSSSKAGNYPYIAAYLMGTIEKTIRNDMPKNLFDNVFADALKASTTAIFVKTLFSLWQPILNGIVPAIGKMLTVSIIKKRGNIQLSPRLLAQAYWLAIRDYAVNDGVLAKFTQENSINSYKWKAQGAEVRDTQISQTKYKGQKLTTYLSRKVMAKSRNLGEKLMDWTIGRPERAMVQSLFAFELFNQLQETMQDRAPKTLEEMLSMNPDEIDSNAKTRADIMVTDYMGLGDRAKKAGLYNIESRSALKGMLLAGLTRYGNHSMTVGANMMVNGQQVWNSKIAKKDGWDDPRMTQLAVENALGTFIQNSLFFMARAQISVPLVLWAASAVLSAFGDDDEEEISERTVRWLRKIQTSDELETEGAMSRLGRFARDQIFPSEFNVTKGDFIRKSGGYDDALRVNFYTAMRDSMLDLITAIPGIGATLATPVVSDQAKGLITKTAEKAAPDDAKWMDIMVDRSNDVFDPLVQPIESPAESAENFFGIFANRLIPKEGYNGTDNADFIEGLINATIGTREGHRSYYKRAEKKGGWGSQ